MSELNEHAICAAVEEHHPGSGELVKDARAAGVPWAAILGVIITNFGPALVQALKDLIAKWTNPTPAPPTPPPTPQA